MAKLNGPLNYVTGRDQYEIDFEGDLVRVLQVQCLGERDRDHMFIHSLVLSFIQLILSHRDLSHVLLWPLPC